MIASSVCGSSTSACASSIWSAAAIVVSTIDVVSPWSAPCSVTATIAPVSRSTACSALCARWVRPSFIFVIFASGSEGLLVRALLLPASIQARQSLTTRSLDSRCFRQPLQEVLIALSRVLPNDASHRRVRFQGRPVDRHRLADQKPSLGQTLLNPGEHLAVGLHVDQTPVPRDRRMVWCCLLRLQPKEAPNRQRIRHSPRHSTLRVQSLEVPHHQYP